MADFEQALLAINDEVTQAALARFGDVKLSDYARFTPEKRREYMEAVSSSVARAILGRSAFLRTCVRQWGVEEFIAQVSVGIRGTWTAIENTTDSYVRSDPER